MVVTVEVWVGVWLGVGMALGVLVTVKVRVGVLLGGGVTVGVFVGDGANVGICVGVRVAVAAGVVDPRHCPFIQRSVVVHTLPSSHCWPSLRGCMLMQLPVPGSHCPTEHVSLQVFGAVSH